MSETTEKLSVTTPPCMGCGSTTEMLLEADKVRRYTRGEFVQKIWPELSTSERELIMTGTHSECWDKMFKEEEP